jgi:very-short-patch-repair endonuclease
MPSEFVEAHRIRMTNNPPKPMLGKRHSEESIQKMREARRNRVVDPVKEAKRIEALKAAVTGKPKSPEHREKIRAGVLNYIGQGGHKMTTMQNTKGERQIAKKLDELGITFQRQYLLKGRLHDFYLPDFNLIIEFDGAHHWDHSWFTPQHLKEEALYEQGVKDKIRNESAENLGYRIIVVRGKHEPGDSFHGTFEAQMMKGWCGDIFSEDHDFGSSFDVDQEVISYLRDKSHDWRQLFDEKKARLASE